MSCTIHVAIQTGNKFGTSITSGVICEDIELPGVVPLGIEEERLYVTYDTCPVFLEQNASDESGFDFLQAKVTNVRLGLDGQIAEADIEFPDKTFGDHLDPFCIPIKISGGDPSSATDNIIFRGFMVSENSSLTDADETFTVKAVDYKWAFSKLGHIRGKIYTTRPSLSPSMEFDRSGEQTSGSPTIFIDKRKYERFRYNIGLDNSFEGISTAERCVFNENGNPNAATLNYGDNKTLFKLLGIPDTSTGSTEPTYFWNYAQIISYIFTFWIFPYTRKDKILITGLDEIVAFPEKLRIHIAKINPNSNVSSAIDDNYIRPANFDLNNLNPLECVDKVIKAIPGDWHWDIVYHNDTIECKIINKTVGVGVEDIKILTIGTEQKLAKEDNAANVKSVNASRDATDRISHAVAVGAPIRLESTLELYPTWTRWVRQPDVTISEEIIQARTLFFILKDGRTVSEFQFDKEVKEVKRINILRTERAFKEGVPVVLKEFPVKKDDEEPVISLVPTVVNTIDRPESDVIFTGTNRSGSQTVSDFKGPEDFVKWAKFIAGLDDIDRTPDDQKRYETIFRVYSVHPKDLQEARKAKNLINPFFNINLTTPVTSRESNNFPKEINTYYTGLIDGDEIPFLTQAHLNVDRKIGAPVTKFTIAKSPREETTQAGQTEEQLESVVTGEQPFVFMHDSFRSETSFVQDFVDFEGDTFSRLQSREFLIPEQNGISYSFSSDNTVITFDDPQYKTKSVTEKNLDPEKFKYPEDVFEPAFGETEVDIYRKVFMTCTFQTDTHFVVDYLNSETVKKFNGLNLIGYAFNENESIVMRVGAVFPAPIDKKGHQMEYTDGLVVTSNVLDENSQLVDWNAFLRTFGNGQVTNDIFAVENVSDYIQTVIDMVEGGGHFKESMNISLGRLDLSIRPGDSIKEIKNSELDDGTGGYYNLNSYVQTMDINSDGEADGYTVNLGVKNRDTFSSITKVVRGK